MQKTLDLFAGPGGWDVHDAELGLITDGVELDAAARATREAAGLRTVHDDVTTFKLRPGHGYTGLKASPPCQTFSAAGNGHGRRSLDVVLAQLERVFRRNSELDYAHFSDARTGLVLEPMRVILAAWFLSEPFTWVVLEQVPAVLPVWEAYARYLRELGYSVAVGNLHAEQYGVPQTRKRAVLLAYHSTAVTVTLPEPTHSKFHSRTPERLDAGVLPWVSMAQALRYGLSGRPAPTVTGGGTYTGGAEPISHLSRWTERDDWVQRSNYSRGSSDGSTAEERGRTERQADQPSTTVTSKGFQWMRRNSGPGAARTPRLTEDAPSYTIRANGSGMHPSGVEWMDQGEHAARVTVAEAAVLQTFPVGYPWQGGLGKQYQQVGNAIPPLLAKAILQQVV